MTRIWIEGFEFGDSSFWDIVGSGTATTTQKRSGAYSHIVAGTANIKNIPNLSEFYLRFGFRAAGLASNPPIVWRNAGGTKLGGINYDATLNRFTANVGNNTTAVATGITPISIDTWYLLEIHLKLDDADGIIQLKIDGVMDIDYSGSKDTKPGADTYVSSIAFWRVGTGNVFYDDVALNDTSNADGLNDNSWCGDGHIVLLTPNGNGNANQFTGSDGNTTDNFLLVDDFPHDTDTTYVQDSVSGHQDAYDLTDFSGTGVTVSRVWAEARARDTVAAGGTLHLGVRTHSADYITASARSLLTTYTQIKGDVYKTNPNTGQPWTDSELDAVQFLAQIP